MRNDELTVWTAFDHYAPPDEFWPPEGVFVLVRLQEDSHAPEIVRWERNGGDYLAWWDTSNDYHDGIPDWGSIEWAPIRSDPQTGARSHSPESGNP